MKHLEEITLPPDHPDDGPRAAPVEALVATSFDRYARYLYVHELRREWFGPEPIRIIDVGDPYGMLADLLPGDDTISVDLYAEGRPRRGLHQHVIGSGFSLPFEDGAFDLAASHDVLEHVPADQRHRLVEELLRVSRGPVVLVAPFAEPRTERCEQVVNAYYVARIGSTLQPLDEHAEGGLPDLAWLTGWLGERGVAYRLHSDGWLYHWLAFMLLKAHFVAEGAVALDHAVDTAFNVVLRGRDSVAPHYRRAVVMRPPPYQGSSLPGPLPSEGDVEGDLARLTALGWEIAHALPAGSNPALAGSPLRQWVEERVRQSGPAGDLARSIGAALDAANELLAGTSPFDLRPLASSRSLDGQRPASPVEAGSGGTEARLKALQVLAAEQEARLALYEARPHVPLARWLRRCLRG